MSTRFLPVAIAVVLFVLVSFVFKTGTRVLDVAVWVAYGAVLVAVVGVVCRRWTSARSARMAMWASATGHVIAMAAYFLSEVLRPAGIERVSNSFRTLGFEYVLISVAYPLRFGGLLIGLGTALILIVIARLSRVRSERWREQS